MKLALQDLFLQKPLRHTTNLSRQEMTSSVKIYSIFTLQTPPFYALPIVLITGKSFAGAETSSNHQALENVYIIGESSGFLGDPSVGWGFSGSITACYSQGKLVAETIKTKIDSR